ncbi:MAG: hypothetical protein H7A41_08725 [Chlamydiales bacterium]|nr:hypothetical protein [Chlamydiales bacterium]
MGTQLINSQSYATKFPYVKSYPVDLEQSIKKISDYFPMLLQKVFNQIQDFLVIMLVVDLPHDTTRGVKVSALKERSISVRALTPDGAGYVSSEALFKQNIVIGQETFPACWSWKTKTIYVAQYEGYGKFFNQEEHQILNLLFEMHNACQTQRLLGLHEKGKEMGKKRYVRACEDLELSSAKETRKCIETMIKDDEFDEEENIFKLIYLDPELNYLFQQLSGHSFAIAKNYDDFFPDSCGTPYHGTWATPFDRSNPDHLKVCEQLRAILKGHLQAIFHQTEDDLIEAMKQTQHLDDRLFKMVEVNLEFFREKYQQSVEREKTHPIVEIPSFSLPLKK